MTHEDIEARIKYVRTKLKGKVYLNNGWYFEDITTGFYKNEGGYYANPEFTSKITASDFKSILYMIPEYKNIIDIPESDLK